MYDITRPLNSLPLNHVSFEIVMHTPVYKIKLGNRKAVLCRINGIGSEEIINRDREINHMIRIMHELSESTVHCRFGNGVLYDFIDGVPLETTDVTRHAEGIASQMARFHKIETDEEKSPLLFRVMDDWISKARMVSFDDHIMQNKLDALQFKDKILPEIDSLRKVFDGWEVTFCHNDTQGYNIIYDEKTNSYSFIDYEYCGYNYRAFDIGNHFFEYLGLAEYDPTSYPCTKQQKRFVRAYLRELTGSEPTEREVEKLRRQANIAGLTSNLFWGTWSVFQAKNSSIDFDYLQYAKDRFSVYFLLKDRLYEDPDSC